MRHLDVTRGREIKLVALFCKPFSGTAEAGGGIAGGCHPRWRKEAADEDEYDEGPMTVSSSEHTSRGPRLTREM